MAYLKMAALAVLQGRANRASQTAKSFWAPARCRLLIDNRPTRFAGEPHLSEGDSVTVVGDDWKEFHALAMRNDSTGVEYRPAVASLVAGAILALVSGAGAGTLVAYTMSRLTGQLAGFPLFMGSFMAMPMLIAGLGLLFNARRNARANQTLSLTSPFSAAGAQAVLQPPMEEPESAAVTLAPIFVGVVGLLLVIAAALATAATISLAAGEFGMVDTVIALVLSLAVGVGGFALVRWAVGSRRRAVQG